MAPHYRHTQPATQLLVIMGLATLFIIGAVLLTRPQAGTSDDVRIILSVVAAILLVTSVAFSTLTVEVTDREVKWRFTLLVRRSLPLADIATAKPIETTLIDGIGIHWTRGGWLYNVSGRGAVELRTRDGRTVRIGSPEPAALAAAIERALPTHP